MAGLLLSLIATPALACSMVGPYVPPSNFELAQIADAIVVAKPVSQSSARQPNKVTFRVSETLKGRAADRIEVSQLYMGDTTPSDPNDIVNSHPDNSACNRSTLQRGGDYLLFLTERDGSYFVVGLPFSRVNEDYGGRQSLWSRTVRSYLDIQRTASPMEQLARLESLRAQLELSKDPGDLQRAGDITNHLGSISPWKPTEYLLDALRRVRQGSPPRYPPGGGYWEMVEADLSVDERRRSIESRIIESLVKGEHPGAASEFEPYMKPGATPQQLTLAMRFLASNGRARAAYDLVEQQAERVISTASEEEVYGFLQAASDALEGSGNSPPWRADPYLADRWPKLALRLAEAWPNAYGTFSETLRTLVKDYRANPVLTLELAGGFQEITGWANKELTKPAVLSHPRSDGWDDPLTLPLRIAVTWLSEFNLESEPALTAVACRGSPE